MGDQLEPGCQVADRYVVEELIGSGGFADVYRARHLELGSVHALKVLTWRKKGLAERFINEGRVQATLGHPNVVTVTDVLRFEGHVALVMEYVDGTSLEDLLNERGGLPLQEAMALFVPVLAAVAAAHDRKIWHRDLKPANVLLARTPVGFVPKVADFGIAKIMDEMGVNNQTSSGIAMGSPGYMAPEQVRDSAGVDQRTDVFALGAILYEVLTGRRAFGDADGVVTLTSTLDREPPLIEDPAVPPEIALAIRKAMSREREQRFPDCRSFAKALGIGGHPLLLELIPPGETRPEGESRGLFASVDYYDPDVSRLSTLGDRSKGRSKVSTGGPLGQLQRITTTAPGGGWLVVPFAAVTLAMTAAAGLLVVGGILVAVMKARYQAPEQVEVIPPISAPSELAQVRAQAPEPTPPAPSEAGPQAEGPQAEGTPSEATPPEAGPEPAQPKTAAPAPEETPAPEPKSPEPSPPQPQGTSEPPPPAPEVADAQPSSPSPQGTAEASPPAPAAPTYDASALLGATWKGTARGFPFELRFTSASPELVRGEGVFFAGTSQTRVVLSGTLDQATGALLLRSADGRNKFEGQLKGQAIRGTYQQGGGKLLEWSVSR